MNKIASALPRIGSVRVAMLICLGATAAHAQSYTVKTDNKSLVNAVFPEDPAHNRQAESYEVSCKLSVDARASALSGTCTIPVSEFKIADVTNGTNEENEGKTTEFHKWFGKKKVAADKCKYELSFDQLKLAGPVNAKEHVALDGQVKLAVCARPGEKATTAALKDSEAILQADGTLWITLHLEDTAPEHYGLASRGAPGWSAEVTADLFGKPDR